uniref:Tetratricopeptide repeat protein n=1 Tax=Magnetococcus massalia (strain MO-1) TaxID=451514 RepID=A0A1S7LHY4_MAGMO|nr:exported protein of unknown function. Tetratricopeptide-like helical [Candidatus Magnetococcus massalia]
MLRFMLYGWLSALMMLISVHTALGERAELSSFAQADRSKTLAEWVESQSQPIIKKLPSHSDIHSAKASYLSARERESAQRQMSLDLYQEALIKDPGYDRYLVDLISLLSELYHTQEALDLSERLLELSEARYGEAHPHTGSAYTLLGILFTRNLQQFAKGEQAYRRALEIWTKSYGAQSYKVAQALSNLVGSLHHQGRYGETEPLLQRALKIKQRLYGADSYTVRLTQVGLAQSYRGQGRYAEAMAIYGQLLADPQLQHDAALHGHVHYNLARIHQAKGLYAKAYGEISLAMQRVRPLYPLGHPTHLRHGQLLKQILLAWKKPELQGTLDAQLQEIPTIAPITRVNVDQLLALLPAKEQIEEATRLEKRGQQAESEHQFKVAIQHYLRSIDKDSASVLAMERLARLLIKLGLYQQAEPWVEALVVRQTERLYVEESERFSALRLQADLLTSGDQVKAAEALLLDIMQQEEQSFGEATPETMRALAENLNRQGRYAEAEERLIQTVNQMRVKKWDRRAEFFLMPAALKSWYHQGRCKEVMKLSQQTIEYVAKNRELEAPFLLRLLLPRALCQRALKMPEAAKETAQRALAVVQTHHAGLLLKVEPTKGAVEQLKKLLQ